MTKPKLASVKPRISMVAHHGPRTLGTSFGDKARLTATQRGYGPEWRRTRLRILQRDRYVCQCTRCKEDGVVRPAHEVDHIVPKFEAGTDHDDNLQAINRDCHILKTKAEAARARQLGIEWPPHDGAGIGGG
jgi:5-methylcytosine-specific restriction protein A